MRKRREQITPSDRSQLSEPPSWPDDEPEDARSPVEKLLDQLRGTAVGPLREVLQFKRLSYAREHYQAHEDDPMEVLLLKLVEAQDDPFVSSADRKRLRRFSLRPYFLGQ